MVAIAQHAERGGRGGYVVIESRFLALTEHEHVPVTIDWTTAARATATGSSRNIPGFVGAIPFIGYVLGPYGFIHHGSDITIAHGTRLPVLIGDDVATAACRIMPPPTPAPTPTATAMPSPSTTPSSPPASATPTKSSGTSPAPMPSTSTRMTRSIVPKER